MDKCKQCGGPFHHDGLPFGTPFPDICFNCHTPEQRVTARTGWNARKFSPEFYKQVERGLRELQQHDPLKPKP